MNCGSLYRFAFVMCNPPFYVDEALATSNPWKGYQSTASESVCEGGEVGFVSKMMAESANSPNRALWFTSLLSSKNSLTQLRNVLQNTHDAKGNTVSDYYEFTLKQGKQSRWVICWSWLKRSVRHRVLVFSMTNPPAVPSQTNASYR
eukprot:Lankesteria_metandrocarpae@DN5278_c0_g1_i10.p2